MKPSDWVTEYVVTYPNGSVLHGTPTPELVRAGFANGTVHAYRDEYGVWNHVLDCDVSTARTNGVDVRAVWIEAAS